MRWIHLNKLSQALGGTNIRPTKKEEEKEEEEEEEKEVMMIACTGLTHFSLKLC